MESLSDWVRSVCDSVLQVNDSGAVLELEGVQVIGADPSRGFDVNFALQTYHPENVLAVHPDDKTCEEVLSCITVERFFYVGDDAPEAPDGWKGTPSPHGMMYERILQNEPA